MNKHMRQRGFNMVDNTELIETPVKFEFNLEKNISEFNIREKMINLLEKIKKSRQTPKNQINRR